MQAAFLSYKRRSVQIILLFAFSTLAYGQSQKIVPVSPEASALAKVVNCPVNLNTGIPDISIPLYQVESGGLSLPITLNYHSGGFKINERSTSVGLGWSLSSDIQITRTINGLDDFMQSPVGYIANTKMKASSSSSNYNSSLDYPLYNSSSNAFDIAAGDVDGMPDKFNYKLLHKSGSFYFQKNSAGDGYTIVPVPFDNIKITYNSVDDMFNIIDTDGTGYLFGGLGAKEHSGYGEVTFGDYAITAWKCNQILNSAKTEEISFAYTDKSEIKFFNSQDRIEYYYNENPCALTQYGSNTEYLRSSQLNILYPDVTTFESLATIAPLYRFSSPRYTEYFSLKNQAFFHLPDLDNQNQVVDKIYTVNAGSPGSVSTSSGLALSQISFRGGKIVFSGTDQLYSIAVQDGNGSEIRTISFSQSYAQPSDLIGAKSVNGNSFNGTLYLDAIQVKRNGTVFEQYSLQYKDKYCFGSHLMGKDAWGYANDRTVDGSGSLSGYNSISVPNQQIKQRFMKDIQGGCGNYVDNVIFNIGNSTNTEMPGSQAQHGILKRIIYPTGGYIDFDFESNMYKQSIGNNIIQGVRMGGGLRVRAINYYDGASDLPVSQKYYRYGELEDGIGLLINAPNRNFDESKYEYNPYTYKQTTTYLTGPTSTDLGKDFEPVATDCRDRGCMIARFSETKTTYEPASALSNTYATGASIYYTKVTEYNSDLGKNTGKKVYTFFSPGEFSPYSPFFTLSKVPGTNIDVLQTDGLMGQQQFLKEFKYEKGSYSLIHSKEYAYTKYNRPQQVRVVYSYFNVLYQLVGGNFQGFQRDLYHGANDVYSISDYIAGQYAIQVGKMLLTSETEKWFKDAETISQTTQYYYDNAEYCQPTKIATIDSKGRQLIQTLKYAYDFSEPVYTQMTLNNMISQPVEEIIYNTSIGKEISSSKTNYGLITNTSAPTFIAPVSVQKSVGGNVAQTQLTYDLYDRFGNVLQVTGKDGLPVSYVWGYDNKYVIAEITGAPYAAITSSLGAFSLSTLQNTTDDTQIKTALNSLRTTLPKALVNSFTHKPLIGVSSQINPTGRISYYEYDPFGRLSTVRDQDNNIVKKYEYNMINSNTTNGNLPYNTNIPMMETFYLERYNGISWQLSLYNHIVPGGTYSGIYPSNLLAMDHMNEGVDNTDVIPSVPADMVNITLFRWCPSPLRRPGIVHVDLIKDESIVFSKSFSPLDISPPAAITLAVPKGTYQISFRHDENYQGSVLKYDFGIFDTNTSSYIHSGDLVNLLPGQSYYITMTTSLE